MLLLFSMLKNSFQQSIIYITMQILNQQIFENKEAAALPSLLESGGLPALISGLSAVHRVNLASALYENCGGPLFVICPDEASVESFARDLECMTGEKPLILNARDFTFYPTLAASRHSEQARISSLDSLARSRASICVASISALMQRCIPPETLLKASFTVSDDR